MVTLKALRKAFGTGSLRKMGAEVGLTPPFTLKQLMAAAAKKGAPKNPIDLRPDSDGIPQSNFTLTWADGGAGHFWKATSYYLHLGAIGKTIFPDVVKTDVVNPSYLYSGPDLEQGARIQYFVQALNAWGRSSGTQVWFTIATPAPPPPPPSGSPPTVGISQLVVFNCSSLHYDLELWVADVTAGGAAQQVGSLSAQYSDAGMCPAPGSQPIVFQPISGHTYQCRIICPQQDTLEGVAQEFSLVGNSSGPVFSYIFPGA